MITIRFVAVTLALLGIVVSSTGALQTDKFDSKQLDTSIWTVYNPDPENIDARQRKGIQLIDLREGKQHHMWHKPAGASDNDGWNDAYRIYQPLEPSESYEVEAKFRAVPKVGEKYQEIGLFVGYDDAAEDKQWPFHKFGCASDDKVTYVYHHAVYEFSYEEGVSVEVAQCPDRYVLKYDGSAYKFSVIYRGSSKVRLVADKIVSAAGSTPKYIGMYVANVKDNDNPAPAFSTGMNYFRVAHEPPPLTSDSFNDRNLDPRIWTVYNPDTANVEAKEFRGSLNIALPNDLPYHHMWHKFCGDPNDYGWNWAYRAYQHLRSPAQSYEVGIKFNVQLETGKEYHEVGLFVGYDDAETNHQWPFHKFTCISNDEGTYLSHYAVYEFSSSEGLSMSVSQCPDRFWLKYDGSSYAFYVTYPEESERELIAENIVSEAGLDPKYVGFFVANVIDNDIPSPAFSTSVSWFQVIEPSPPDCANAVADPDTISQSLSPLWLSTKLTVPGGDKSIIERVEVRVANVESFYRLSGDNASIVDLQAQSNQNILLVYDLYFEASGHGGTCKGVVSVPMAHSIPVNYISITPVTGNNEVKCCNPLTEYSHFGNPTCFEGHRCCAQGNWACNRGSGSTTCESGKFGEKCPCCNPFTEYGKYGNPFCFEGHRCCPDGTWACNNGDGSADCGGVRTRGPFGVACPCCDRYAKPNCTVGTAGCCDDGAWVCPALDGFYEGRYRCAGTARIFDVPPGHLCKGQECPNDIHYCPDGSPVTRNPRNDCKFFPCRCSNDSKICPDNTTVFRDPNNDCVFFPCKNTTQTECVGDVMECPDGVTVVGRDPNNNCEFFPCSNCELDTKLCPGGSIIMRDPELNCEFPLCSTTTPHDCTNELKCCDNGSTVGRDVSNNCEFFPCPSS